jgi:hypothetical protein
MDPNANLQEQANLIGRTDYGIDRRRLAELRRALQAWIAGGGFQPTWQAYPEAAREFKSWERRAAKFHDLHR